MILLITILTITNSLTLLYMLWLYRLQIRLEIINDNKKVVGIGFWWRNKYSSCTHRKFYLPLRNARKQEIRAERQRLMNYSPMNRKQSLHAKFSWLKTKKEVLQFQKDYLCVDAELVQKLVQDFQE
jgi:hypothetical protein